MCRERQEYQGNRRIQSSKESEAYSGKVKISRNGKGTWEREYYQGKMGTPGKARLLRKAKARLEKLRTRRKVKNIGNIKDAGKE